VVRKEVMEDIIAAMLEGAQSVEGDWTASELMSATFTLALRAARSIQDMSPAAIPVLQKAAQELYYGICGIPGGKTH
jgi:hypothetical protein